MAGKLGFRFAKGEKCAYHSMCQSGFCDLGRCALPRAGKPCSPDLGACPKFYYCHPTTQHCVHEKYQLPERCFDDKDCSWGQYCDADRKCKERRDVGADCFLEKQCDHKATCNRGKCVRKCLEDLDCPDINTECRSHIGFYWSKLCLEKESPRSIHSLHISTVEQSMKPPKPGLKPIVVPPKVLPTPRVPTPRVPTPKKPEKPSKVNAPKEPKVPPIKVDDHEPQVAKPRVPTIQNIQSPPKSPSFFQKASNASRGSIFHSLREFARENYVALTIVGILVIIFLIFVVLLARSSRRSRLKKKAAVTAAASASTAPPASPSSIYTTQPTSPDLGLGFSSFPHHHVQSTIPIAPPSYEEVFGSDIGGVAGIANLASSAHSVDDGEKESPSSSRRPHEKS